MSTIDAFVTALGYSIEECFSGKILKERASILPSTHGTAQELNTGRWINYQLPAPKNLQAGNVLVNSLRTP